MSELGEQRSTDQTRWNVDRVGSAQLRVLSLLADERDNSLGGDDPTRWTLIDSSADGWAIDVHLYGRHVEISGDSTSMGRVCDALRNMTGRDARAARSLANRALNHIIGVMTLCAAFGLGREMVEELHMLTGEAVY